MTDFLLSIFGHVLEGIFDEVHNFAFFPIFGVFLALPRSGSESRHPIGSGRNESCDGMWGRGVVGSLLPY